MKMNITFFFFFFFFFFLKNHKVRGVQFFEGLTERYNFHVYDILVRDKEDPTLHNGSHRDDQVADLLFAAAQDDVITVRKVLSLGLDSNAHDYDRVRIEKQKQRLFFSYFFFKTKLFLLFFEK